MAVLYNTCKAFSGGYIHAILFFPLDFYSLKRKDIQKKFETDYGFIDIQNGIGN